MRKYLPVRVTAFKTSAMNTCMYFAWGELQEHRTSFFMLYAYLRWLRVQPDIARHGTWGAHA